MQRLPASSTSIASSITHSTHALHLPERCSTSHRLDATCKRSGLPSLGESPASGRSVESLDSALRLYISVAFPPFLRQRTAFLHREELLPASNRLKPPFPLSVHASTLPEAICSARSLCRPLVQPHAALMPVEMLSGVEPGCLPPFNSCRLCNLRSRYSTSSSKRA